MKEIHIGKWIQAKMEAEGRSAAWLAEQLHCDRSNCYITVKKTASVLAAVIKNIPTNQASKALRKFFAPEILPLTKNRVI